jgi:HdeA/HdeB family
VHHVATGKRDGRPGGFHSAARPGGQIKIDMSLITCTQYSSSDAERREFIASWISGYFRASRSQPVFDFQRFSNNKKAVEKLPKKTRRRDAHERNSKHCAVSWMSDSYGCDTSGLRRTFRQSCISLIPPTAASFAISTKLRPQKPGAVAPPRRIFYVRY